jgi:hypothetical protein
LGVQPLCNDVVHFMLMFTKLCAFTNTTITYINIVTVIVRWLRGAGAQCL